MASENELMLVLDPRQRIAASVAGLNKIQILSDLYWDFSGVVALKEDKHYKVTIYVQ